MSAAGGLYLGLVTGAMPLDLGVGRRTRVLGPRIVEIDAPREVVFDVIASPYAERSSKAMQAKVRVLERASDMVLAAHYTPVRGRLTATTVETVRFARPERVDFRLVRGPVPHVSESFVLQAVGDGTRLTYTGQFGTDLWAVGQRWGGVVTAKWEQAVAESMAAVKVEAERRTDDTSRRRPHSARPDALRPPGG